MTGNVVLGISGASGAVIADRLAREIVGMGHHLHFVCSRYGRLMWEYELDCTIDRSVSEYQTIGDISVHKPGDVAAPPASGSFPVIASAIVPCSMATLGAIASGAGTNLLHRFADVAIKERRPLVFVPRETPLSPIHLSNMKMLTDVGAVILPPMPAFYNKPQSVEDIVEEAVQRTLVAMKLRSDLPETMQWKDAD